MQVTVQNILREHFDGFAKRRPLSLNMRRAAYRMRHCRTAAMGGHVVSCPHGHVDRVVYNSCRHRSCPQCSAMPRESWLSGWKTRLLACPHFQLRALERGELAIPPHTSEAAVRSLLNKLGRVVAAARSLHRPGW